MRLRTNHKLGNYKAQSALFLAYVTPDKLPFSRNFVAKYQIANIFSYLTIAVQTTTKRTTHHGHISIQTSSRSCSNSYTPSIPSQTITIDNIQTATSFPGSISYSSSTPAISTTDTDTDTARGRTTIAKSTTGTNVSYKGEA